MAVERERGRASLFALLHNTERAGNTSGRMSILSVYYVEHMYEEGDEQKAGRGRARRYRMCSMAARSTGRTIEDTTDEQYAVVIGFQLFSLKIARGFVCTEKDDDLILNFVRGF